MTASKSEISSFIRERFPDQERIQRLASEQLTDGRISELDRRVIGEGKIGGQTADLVLAHAILSSAEFLQDGRLAPLDALYFTPNYCESLASNATKSREMIERLESVFAEAPVLLHGETGGMACLFCRRAYGTQVSALLKNPPLSGLNAQRAPGEHRGGYHFPHLSGEAFSLNPYAWHPRIEPRAGAARLLFGLGTRFSTSMQDDFSRLIALGEPRLRPESTETEIRRYAQHRVHVFDGMLGYEISLPADAWAKLFEGEAIVGWLYNDEDWMRLIRGEDFPPMPTPDPILERTTLVEDLRRIVETLETAFGQSVIIEFATRFVDPSHYDFHLLRCRPDAPYRLPDALSKNDCLFRAQGAVLGRRRLTRIERVIYVKPAAYAALGEQNRYGVARLIGRLMRRSEGSPSPTTMLLGPGRWGTTTPSLGVPVSFAEIDETSALGEIAVMHEGLIPELSMGTHFFGCLVNHHIPWFGFRPGSEKDFLDEQRLLASPNRLLDMRANMRRLADVVHVVDFPNPSEPRSLSLYLDSHEREAVGYLSAEDLNMDENR